MAQVNAEMRAKFARASSTVWNKLTSRLQDLYAALRKREKKNARLNLMRGEVPERFAEEARVMRQSYESLSDVCQQLADVLDKDDVDLPQEEAEPEVRSDSAC